jgi:hypothetical protein
VTTTVVTHEEVMADVAPDWSYLAHLSAYERQMLPASAAEAHDERMPYDAELQPVRAPRWECMREALSGAAQMRRDHENEE